jgi:general secretion pathway protein K
MALVLTLMVVAILTAMVVEFAYGVYVSTSALHNWQTSQQLSVAARSAVKLASKLSSSLPPTQGIFEVSQKMPFDDIDGTVTIRIEDENAKFNLNMLTGVTGFGQTPDDVYNSFKQLLKEIDLNAEIADRISYWMDSSSSHRPAGGKIATKNAKLDSVDELLLIPGIDQTVYEKLKPYVTIYGGNAINVNSASIPVLLTIPGINEPKAEELVEKRNNALLSGSDINGSLISYISSASKVTITAESNGIQRIVECVITGGTVNYWEEM